MLKNSFKKVGFNLIICLCLLFSIAVSANAESNKVVKVAVSQNPGLDLLDGIETTGKTLIQVHTMIYEGLVEYGKQGKIEPLLAEKWEISEDGKEYTFFIRKNVLFSDGTPLDANAVKFSFDRWVKDPKYSGFSIAKLLDKITVVDNFTIKFSFTEKYYPLITEFTYPRPTRIVSPTSVSPAGDIAGKFVKPIGTGRWVVESSTEEEGILVPNDKYWNGKSNIDKIILKTIPDPQTRSLAIKNGEIDVVGGDFSIVPVEILPSLKNDENVKVILGENTTSYLAIFNHQNPILQDINVRKAINMALDKELIYSGLMDSVGKPAKALFQADVPYVNDKNSVWYKKNLEEASKLLNESGYSDKDKDGYLTKDGKVLELKLVFSNQEFPAWKGIAEYMQSALKDVGIKVELVNMEVNAYYDSLWKDKNYDLIIYRTYADSWNPDGFLLSLFKGGEDSKGVAWSDAKFDELLDIALRSDEKDRQNNFDNIFDLMYKEAMFIPLYYPASIFVINNKIDNLEFGNDSYSPIKWEKLSNK